MRKLLTLCIALAAIAFAVCAPASAQFNGCKAGFCSGKGGFGGSGFTSPAATGGGATPFALDGTPVGFTGTPGTTSLNLSGFTTTFGNNINMVAITSSGAPVVSITDTAFNVYSKITGGGNYELWFAKCASPQAGNVVTITLTAGSFTSVSLSSFSGAKFSAPFDVNGSLPANGAAVTFSTTDANDILYGMSVTSTGTGTAVAPWNTIYNTSGAFLAVEYQSVSATQSGTSLNFTDNGGNQIAVALVQGP
jgi:hypothetical protein